MAVQTSYPINQGIAYAGAIFALGTTDIVSRSMESTAGVGFGVAVSRGTDKSRQVVLGGTDFLGVTVRDLSEEGSANGDVVIEENATAGIMREGYIWAVCPTGCNAGDAVKYTDATGILDSGSAGAGETALNGATWETTAAAGELAVIRIETTSTTAGS